MKILIDRPVIDRLVQIKDVKDLDEQTRFFLEQHAIHPLEEISVEDTNDFLRECYLNYERPDLSLDYAIV